jgi:hypothetical protein
MTVLERLLGLIESSEDNLEHSDPRVRTSWQYRPRGKPKGCSHEVNESLNLAFARLMFQTTYCSAPRTSTTLIPPVRHAIPK